MYLRCVYIQNNDDLIDNLISTQQIRTSVIERAFRAVDRAEYYLPGTEGSAHTAHLNSPWKSGNLHLSAPGIYAEVMERLNLKPGLSFLNLGSGTGYLSTVAGVILGRHGVNHGVEYHADVVQYAIRKLENFKRLSGASGQVNFAEPKFVRGNCLCLRSDWNARYDGVYCGAACPEQYEPYMKNLLKVGGILVMPLNNTLVQIKRTTETTWERRSLLSVVFAPLIQPPEGAQEWVNMIQLEPPTVQGNSRPSVAGAPLPVGLVRIADLVPGCTVQVRNSDARGRELSVPRNVPRTIGPEHTPVAEVRQERRVPERLAESLFQAIRSVGIDNERNGTEIVVVAGGEAAAAPRQVGPHGPFLPSPGLLLHGLSGTETTTPRRGVETQAVIRQNPSTSQEPGSSVVTTKNKLILHRGNIFKELLNAVKIHGFEDFKNIKIEMILPNGNLEKADDFGGVLRDALTEFWESFYETCSLGTHLKIPYLRHDFQEQEWRTIGKILASGYSAVGYFPIKIAPVFMMDCFGMKPDEEEIFLNFEKYISDSDAESVKEAINSFDTIDMDELLEICSNYGGKWRPTKQNVKTLFNQIAAEELIQKPAFVKNCFEPELKKISSQIDLKNVYKQLEPSVKNILSKIESKEDISRAESEVMKFLRKFIKESDEKMRCSFLRYCTGSDLPTGKISIEFTGSDGVTRVPVAHTCSGLLQLPRTYENYVTFRSEFQSLLSSGIWIMDLV